MEKIRFSWVAVGKKFTVDGLEYVKTNFGRGWRVVEGRKVFRNVKKSKIVEVDKYEG